LFGKQKHKQEYTEKPYTQKNINYLFSSERQRKDHFVQLW